MIMLVMEQDQIKEEQGEKEVVPLPPPAISGGKSMLATTVGIAFVILGLWGMIHWGQELVFILKGLLPISLFLGGIVAAIVGIASLKPSEELQKLAEDHTSKKSS